MKPPDPDALEAGLQRLTERLVAWGARRVILFGSVARGDYHGASDIDLVVVRETSANFPQRIVEALGACEEADPPLPVEVLVYTPGEFDRMRAEGHPLLRRVLAEGRVLYESRDAA